MFFARRAELTRWNRTTLRQEDAGSIPAASTNFHSLGSIQGAGSMQTSLTELAARIQARPWNRPGADKTWVLHAMWSHRVFREQVQNARRVGPR